ncbi:exonuclease [Candidatus Woesearchaeota archaeon]|nr:MAG: exonuclease [Candidatus Woesearchaeota archaeon]
MARDIERCFLLLPGVGSVKQQRLFSAGVSSWQEFRSEKGLEALVPKVMSFDKWKRCCKLLDYAEEKLLLGDSSFFAGVLPRDEHWRLYEPFREETIFLDIETTGASRYDRINMIGISDGADVRTMLRGFNMDEELFLSQVKKAKLLVTFNGASFDIPFLKRSFPKAKHFIERIPHIDLRHLCARAGLKGGLKNIEREVGITRKNRTVERIFGGDPLLLWRTFIASGDDYYLQLLIEYNEEDTLNLRPLLEHCIRVLREK